MTKLIFPPKNLSYGTLNLTFSLLYKTLEWTQSVVPPHIANDNHHGTLVSKPARLQLCTNLYSSIGGMEPIAKICSVASKDNQHGTLVCNPARRISQHGTLGLEPSRLQLYTNLYPGMCGMEPIAKIGPAASKNNQHGTLVCNQARQFLVYPSTALGREPARLRLYTNLYPSIGGIEPNAKIDPIQQASKYNQHSHWNVSQHGSSA